MPGRGRTIATASRLSAAEYSVDGEELDLGLQTLARLKATPDMPQEKFASPAFDPDHGAILFQLAKFRR